MAKFGEIINSKVPVLIGFYREHDKNSESIFLSLREAAAELGDKIKVIRISEETNETLINALRIKHYPTYIIYKEGEMKWRRTGENTKDELIEVLKNYI